MQEPIELKLNNKFRVSELMDKLDVDFLYSYNTGERKYLLLNNDLYGEIDVKTIHDQIETDNKVVIIEIPTNVLKSYNIEEQTLIDAFLEIGDL